MTRLADTWFDFRLYFDWEKFWFVLIAGFVLVNWLIVVVAVVLSLCGVEIGGGQADPVWGSSGRLGEP